MTSSWAGEDRDTSGRRDAARTAAPRGGGEGVKRRGVVGERVDGLPASGGERVPDPGPTSRWVLQSGERRPLGGAKFVAVTRTGRLTVGYSHRSDLTGWATSGRQAPNDGVC